MTAKWEKKGTNDGVLTFEIAQEVIQPELTRTFNKVKKNLSVPGFRKGKISRTVFNRMYGEAALYEDTLNVLLPKAYEAAIEEASIEPVSQPKIDVEKMDGDGAWVLTAEVTVKPEVKLGEYKNLTVEKQDREVTEAEVDEAIEKTRETFAELVLKEDEAAVIGDTVVIDYKGMKDGIAFEGGTAENHSLELGSNSFIPGFEEQLVGAKAGDQTEVKVTFPEEYHSEDLAGAEAIFEVIVHEVKAKELPELDDDFAKDADEEVETFAEYKEKIRKNLEETKEKAAKDKVEELAIEQAVANAEIVELPEVMVHDEVHRAMDEFFANMNRQGISPEVYYQITGTTEADLHQQYEVDADKRVKTSLVVEAIAAAEEFEVTEDDINEEITSLAENYGMEVEAVRSALSEDMLKHDIKLKKALSTITDTVKEV
ncbi:trigger factor [Vagococcus elongatus]|uniref:Trigger factor n=1 Tax=Vagococcus elongatus TaxID=180344 RepID=A0A430ARQ7_9ENTE|nr:trigger factor [Vagococcus elongatus]RSU10741.1 trigger factor [Vagococcus elongatus]